MKAAVASDTETNFPQTAQRSLPIRKGPIVTGFFEKRTSSVQYVVADPETKRCAIIDPVLDFDPKSGAIATSSADALLIYIDREGVYA